MLQGYPNTLQSLESMVTEWEALEYFIVNCVKCFLFLTFVLFLEPPTIIPFSFGEHPVNQGDSAQLMCAVTRGDRPLSITWSLKGDIISSDPVLTTTMIGQQTSLLIIAAVDYQHSGTYTCRAENPAGIRTHSAELLVNGNKNYHILEIFYLQSCLKLFLSHLVRSQ